MQHITYTEAVIFLVRIEIDTSKWSHLKGKMKYNTNIKVVLYWVYICFYVIFLCDNIKNVSTEIYPWNIFFYEIFFFKISSVENYELCVKYGFALYMITSTK